MGEILPIILALFGVFWFGFIIGDIRSEPNFYCIECDEKITHESKFCSKCGKEKNWVVVEKNKKPWQDNQWKIKL